ncbi:hypothetical protein, partial [Streptomyces turgidiscabies]|uniref:hypothetical protein n=1 Tax=Streptomyces turgidiscabies TaxID=85558 RepID=UPI0038F5D5FE
SIFSFIFFQFVSALTHEESKKYSVWRFFIGNAFLQHSGRKLQLNLLMSQKIVSVRHSHAKQCLIMF